MIDNMIDMNSLTLSDMPPNKITRKCYIKKWENKTEISKRNNSLLSFWITYLKKEEKALLSRGKAEWIIDPFVFVCFAACVLNV